MYQTMLKFTKPASCYSPTSHVGVLVQGTEVWEVLSDTPTMAANSPSATLSLIITVTVSISSYWETSLPKLKASPNSRPFKTLAVSVLCSCVHGKISLSRSDGLEWCSDKQTPSCNTGVLMVPCTWTPHSK